MKYVVIFLSILLAACANTARNLNAVSVGMTKADVINVLGDPDETRAAEGIEYLIYELRKAPSAGAQTACGVAGVYTLGLAYLFKDCQYSDNDYFVQLKGGKVMAYGRIGDFNSTQKPEATINVNTTVNKPSGE